MLAGVCKPVEWGKRHIEVDYASHPNLIDIRIICHPKDRKQTARLVTQIVETTTDSFDGDQLKSFKFADSCPGPAILYTPIGWLDQQVNPPKGAYKLAGPGQLVVGSQMSTQRACRTGLGRIPRITTTTQIALNRPCVPFKGRFPTHPRKE